MWPFHTKPRTNPPEPEPAGTQRRQVRIVRARYDAAQTTDENARHWANADGLSATAANTLFVRNILRRRGRYEFANNCYLEGMVLTLVNNCIGTGPRLQMLTDHEDMNNRLEAAFRDWAREIHLASKLRTMRISKAVDGEAFAVLFTNPKLRSAIKLDFEPVECDRITSPNTQITIDEVDGIRFDAYGNPVEYCVFRSHPGDLVSDMAYDWLPASQVIHWFSAYRPGQRRGVPDIMPSLPLGSQLRRYTLATLDAAETAANFAGVLQTNAPANGEAVQGTPFESVPLERNMITSLPDGWTLGQVDAKQPTTTYPMFKREILNEMARPLLMPRNIAAGDSSDYNYASGRMDHQTYFTGIHVEQDEAEERVVDPIVAGWFGEALTVRQLAAGLIALGTRHTWFWDGTEHVDPQKEANAQETRLKNNTTTLADEWQRRGEDWEEKLELIAKIEAKKKQLEQKYGIKFPEPKPAAGPQAPEPDTAAEAIAELGIAARGEP